VREFVGKKLQGDVATQLQVFRLVHHTHSPAADPAEDAVMGDGLTYGLGRSSHWVAMVGMQGRQSQRGRPPTKSGHVDARWATLTMIARSEVWL